MKKQIDQVREFHVAMGIRQQGYPGIPSIDRVKLRHKIMLEEVNELREASDIVAAADGIIDCLYILIGTAIEYGVADKIEAMFDEVHRSNMSKLGPFGKPYFREDGKVLKGPNYSPPDLSQILKSKHEN